MAGRPPVALLFLLLVTITTAGCLGKRGGDRDDEALTEQDALPVTVQIAGVEPYNGDEDLAVEFVIGHVAFLESGSEEWVPLLTESVTVTVFFSPDATPAVVGTFPIFEGDYTDAELVAVSATVLSSSGENPADIDEGVCYTAISLDLGSESAADSIDLLLSGMEALEEDGAWRFRPALVGALTSGEDGEPTIEEASCAPLGS